MVAMGIGGPTDISYTELMDVANNVTDNFLWLKTLSSFLLNGTQVLHERICRVTEGRDLSTTAIPTVITKDPNDPEELCARCKCVGKVIIPDPFDCSRYHICLNSKLESSEHCDPNKFWDPTTKTCQQPMTANCQYDPCYLRPDGYNYTTVRLLEENRCDQFYTCLNGRTKKLCTCGERQAGNILIHRKYDPLSDHCVDDTKGECFTLINKNHQKATKPETWECYTRPASSKEKYINIKTNKEQMCPTNYIYSHEKCQCMVEIVKVKTDKCKADIDLQFNGPSIQLWNVTLKDGQGVFDGKTTMVSIRNMANHYAHDFAVKISMKTPKYKDMLLFENSNCQETDLPSIRVHLKKINGLLGVVAEIKTAHGYVKLQLQSMALRYEHQTTLTLASKGHKVAMWTVYDDGNLRSAIRESDVTMALPAEPHLHCNSPLYLGRGVERELSPFEGTVDFFQWFYSCLPADVVEFFDHT